MGTGSFAKAAAVALLGLVAAQWSSAAVSLDLPDVTISANGGTVNLPATFAAGASETLSLDTYNLFVTVTGPSEAVTLGDATGIVSPFTSPITPFFFSADPANGPTSAGYMYSDVYLAAGAATVSNGTVFATFAATVAAGATPGVYHVDFYTVEDPYESLFINSAVSLDGLPVAFSGGTITVTPIPEPAMLGFAVVSAAMLLRRRH